MMQTKSVKKQTALHLAVENGSMNMIRCLCPLDNPLALDIREITKHSLRLCVHFGIQKTRIIFWTFVPMFLSTACEYHPLHLALQLQLGQRIYTMDPFLLRVIGRQMPAHTFPRTTTKDVDTVIDFVDTNPRTCRFL